MAEQEGVIKYQLTFTETEPLPEVLLTALQQWRLTLFQLGLIGQDPERYGGLGYGNISIRHPSGEGFIISGTQTGGLAQLSSADYCYVSHCDPFANLILASGAIKPSSEALTHGAIYALDDKVQAVIHTHSPEIWQQSKAILLPETPADVPYGTPEMAQSVADLWQKGELSPAHIFVMAGHEDGVVSFGETLSDAGMTMLNNFQWARAFCLNAE